MCTRNLTLSTNQISCKLSRPEIAALATEFNVWRHEDKRDEVVIVVLVVVVVLVVLFH